MTEPKAQVEFRVNKSDTESRVFIFELVGWRILLTGYREETRLKGGEWEATGGWSASATSFHPQWLPRPDSVPAEALREVEMIFRSRIRLDNELVGSLG